MIELTGRWALILGASSGMGRATALALADAGVNVIGVHFDTALVAESVNDLVPDLESRGVKACFFNMNAASDRTRAELVPRVGELTGGEGVHVVMHSLAFGTLVPFLPRGGAEERMSRRQLEMTVDVMAHSLVYWVQDLAEAGLLSPGGKVFAMTSAGDVQALPSYGAVSAAKCALESHVRQLACELAPFDVAVNALRAGVTITPSLQRIPEHGEFVEGIARSHPFGRLTRAEDVAEAIVLLSRAGSSWITGNVIGVDGGELVATGSAWGPGTGTTESRS